MSILIPAGFTEDRFSCPYNITNNTRMANQKHILVVDDEQENRTALADQLAVNGYAVDTASDGDEAIAIISAKAIDLVLLDVIMKRVDGLEVLRFIQKNHPEIKVVMLTAFGDFKNAETAKKLGAKGFIIKPCDPDDMAATIKIVLGA
ncbi:MAG TPA: response regulator [Bacteroidota bacterium]|nr:response regulator [Bacteroidota bacterium]